MWARLLPMAAVAAVAVLLAPPHHAGEQFNLDAARPVASAAGARTVLVPLPSEGFDPTEAAVPWAVLTRLGHRVVFATPDGRPSGGCDPRCLEGFFGGAVMRILDEPRRFYEQMTRSEAYLAPVAFADVRAAEYDAVLVPGGHAAGMQSMLSDAALHGALAEFWRRRQPVGAICHGVLALARARDPETGGSLLRGRRTTAVPRYLERLGVAVTDTLAGLPSREYQLSTTWPRYTQDEVAEAVGGLGRFDAGPLDLLGPLLPGSDHSDAHTYLVEDGHYLSARYWGDAYAFAKRFAALVQATPARPEEAAAGGE